jgi:DNA-binding MltR family transcriptional regulator
MSKGSHLYSYGLITYDDIFDASHWITFCMRLNAEGTGYEFCEQNNDAGDGTYKGQ